MSKVTPKCAAIVLTLSLPLLIACERKQIQGSVRDPFGKAIDGVTVKIEKSSFETITDREGHYSLDYAPGTFILKFSKPSYTTQQLELTISQMTSFLAETVEMYPIPSSQGIFCVGADQLIELRRGGIKKKERRGFLFGSTARYYASDDSNVSVKPGQTIFIDTDTQNQRLAKLGSDGLILDAALFMGSPTNIKFNGFLSDDAKQVGEEKLWLRKVNLEPGRYAWVELVSLLTDARLPGKVCYPFVVEPLEEKKQK
jgi:hypothetical protein